MKKKNPPNDSKFVPRSLSLNERLYQLAEDIAPPFCITYVVKGEGSWELESIKEAVKKLGQLFPMLRAELKGSSWKQGQREIPLSVYSDPLPDDWNDAVFRTSLADHNADFQVFTKGNPVLIFRVLHRVMDAKGVQQVLKAFFQLLRKEAVAPAPGFPADHAIRQQLSPVSKLQREGYAFRWASLPLSSDSPSAYTTLALSFSDQIPHILSQTAAWLTQHLQAPTRFLIPVDIRRHEGCPEAAANLSLPLYVRVSPGESGTEVQERLLKGLYQHDELAREPFEKIGRNAPKAFLKALFSMGIKRASRKQAFPMSGFLSDNGSLSLSDFCTPAFKAIDIWAFPVFVPLAPFCMVALHHDAGTRLLISLPEGSDTELIQQKLQEFLSPLPSPIAPAPTIPPSPIHPALISLWAEVLELQETDIQAGSSFLELGGDSLKLLMLMTEVQQEFPSSRQSLLMDAVLNLAGSFDIQQFSQLISEYHDPTLSPS